MNFDSWEILEKHNDVVPKYPLSPISDKYASDTFSNSSLFTPEKKQNNNINEISINTQKKLIGIKENFIDNKEKFIDEEEIEKLFNDEKDQSKKSQQITQINILSIESNDKKENDRNNKKTYKTIIQNFFGLIKKKLYVTKNKFVESYKTKINFYYNHNRPINFLILYGMCITGLYVSQQYYTRMLINSYESRSSTYTSINHNYLSNPIILSTTCYFKNPVTICVVEKID